MGHVRKLTAAIICSFSLLAGPQAAAETLGDALVAAYRNSNLLEQNRAILRAADEDVATAVASLRPVLNFLASVRFQDVRQRTPGMATAVDQSLSASLALNAEITLYDFGRGQLAIDAAKQNVLATRQALIGVEQQVLFNAVAAFVDVRRAIQTVQLRRESIDLIENELSAIRARLELGEATQTEVAVTESRLAGARSSLAAAEGDLAAARESYRAATGAYPGTLASMPALPSLPGSLSEAQSIARNTHPSIRQAQYEVSAVEINVQRAAAAGQGTVGLSGTAAIDQQRSTSTTLELSFSRPIYQGGGLSSAHRQAMAQRDATRSALHHTVAGVLQEVGSAWADLDVTRATIAANRQQAVAAETVLDGRRQELDLGAATVLDLLDAEQSRLDARFALLSAEANQQLAAYALLGAMGLLTVEHLNLGIPSYDPDAYYRAVADAPRTSSQSAALDRVMRSIGGN